MTCVTDPVQSQCLRHCQRPQVRLELVPNHVAGAGYTRQASTRISNHAQATLSPTTKSMPCIFHTSTATESAQPSTVEQVACLPVHSRMLLVAQQRTGCAAYPKPLQACIVVLQWQKQTRAQPPLQITAPGRNSSAYSSQKKHKPGHNHHIIFALRVDTCHQKCCCVHRSLTPTFRPIAHIPLAQHTSHLQGLRLYSSMQVQLLQHQNHSVKYSAWCAGWVPSVNPTVRAVTPSGPPPLQLMAHDAHYHTVCRVLARPYGWHSVAQYRVDVR